MHSVYVKIDKHTREVIFRAVGHADSGEYGHDLVCAAASMLSQTLSECMAAAYQSGWVGDSAIAEVENGNAEVSCKCDSDEVFGEMARIYLVIATGYRLLAVQYPQYVELTTDIKV